MPKSKGPGDDREKREREERGRQGEHGEHGPHEPEGYTPGGGEERPRRRRMGRDREVHAKIVEKRLEGGAPATPDAYDKALEEWHQLPGSITRPPTDVKAAPKGKDEAEKEKSE